MLSDLSEFLEEKICEEAKDLFIEFTDGLPGKIWDGCAYLNESALLNIVKTAKSMDQKSFDDFAFNDIMDIVAKGFYLTGAKTSFDMYLNAWFDGKVKISSLPNRPIPDEYLPCNDKNHYTITPGHFPIRKL